MVWAFLKEAQIGNLLVYFDNSLCATTPPNACQVRAKEFNIHFKICILIVRMVYILRSENKLSNFGGSYACMYMMFICSINKFVLAKLYIHAYVTCLFIYCL